MEDFRERLASAETAYGLSKRFNSSTSATYRLKSQFVQVAAGTRNSTARFVPPAAVTQINPESCTAGTRHCYADES